VSAFKAMLSKYLLFTEMSLLWFLQQAKQLMTADRRELDFTR